VKEIVTGQDGSFPTELVNVGGTLRFVADDGTGFEPWRSDGTPNGTVPLKNVNPFGTSYPASLTDVNGTLFFVANDGSSGDELWKSDGTPGGTMLVRDIDPGGSSSPSQLVNLNGVLLFRAIDPAFGEELWRSNGTLVGTTLVKEVSSATQSANPGDLTVVGTRAFFWADDGDTGFEPWTTDGTTDGTVAVADIEVGVRVSSFPSSFTPIGGVTYFAAGGAGDRELWKVDDASLVASRVKDVNPSGSAAVTGEAPERATWPDEDDVIARGRSRWPAPLQSPDSVRAP